MRLRVSRGGVTVAQVLIAALAACSPFPDQPVTVTTRPTVTSAPTIPLPSFPANVTYAGWIIAIESSDELVVARATMGSPPVFQGRTVVLRGPHQPLAAGTCVLVEFVAQPEKDTHRLISLDLTKQPTNVEACPPR
jgi:hypothetical protein